MTEDIMQFKTRRRTKPDDQVLSLTVREFEENDQLLLIRSFLLGEDVYLVPDRKYLDKLNSKLVPYLPEELQIIAHLSPAAIKWIHEIKKWCDGEIIGRST